MPTADRFELQNEGRHVRSVQIVGHPINEPGIEQLGSLHLSEAITYMDGKVDIVGYFAHGAGFAHNMDPFEVQRPAFSGANSEANSYQFDAIAQMSIASTAPIHLTQTTSANEAAEAK